MSDIYEIDADEFNEPEEDDICTEDHLTYYQYGKVYASADNCQDASVAVLQKMNKDQFWPNVWFISDHGNAHLITFRNEF